MAPRLNANERKRLARDEETIRTAARSFVAAGQALERIREQRLYRETHAKFEAYCLERFGFQRAYAYRLIASARVMGQLSPMGDKLGWVPQTETQARPLALLDDDELPEVVREIVSEAPRDDGGRPVITAELVAAGVKRWQTPGDEYSRRRHGDEKPRVAAVGTTASKTAAAGTATNETDADWDCAIETLSRLLDEFCTTWELETDAGHSEQLVTLLRNVAAEIEGKD